MHQPDTATVVRPGENEPLITGGPYSEGTESLGGFWIVQTDDLDGALGWARRITDATGLPVGVLPFQFTSVSPG